MNHDMENISNYYGARYYDPRVSVWLSVDQRAHWYPTTSPYAYVLNNPVNLTDPTGMSAICESCPDDEEEFDFFRNSPTEYEYDEETDEVTRVSGGDLDEVEVVGEKGILARVLDWLGSEGGGIHWTTNKGGDLHGQGQEQRRGYGPSMDADDWSISPIPSRGLNSWKDAITKAADFWKLVTKAESVQDQLRDGNPPASHPVPSKSEVPEPAPSNNDTTVNIGTDHGHYWEGTTDIKIPKDKLDSLKSTLNKNQSLY